MNQAIIIGTYEFIGFHFCLNLLEKGIEVTGIHMQTEEQDLFLEEKRMEIGRNDNFSEKNTDYLLSLNDFSENTVVFIDYYSYYLKHADKELMSVVNKAFMSHYPSRIVLLLPIQIYMETLKENFNENLVFLQTIHHEATSTYFYLPTVYGPWQPVEFTFQHSIMYPDKPIMVSEREWTEDALFIDDTVEIIMNSILDKGSKSYLLRSKKNNHWLRIASMLLNQPLDVISKPLRTIGKDITILDVDGTEIIDGIEKQKKHLMSFRKREDINKFF